MKFDKLSVGQKFKFTFDQKEDTYIKTHPMEVRYLDDIKAMEWGNSICLEDGAIVDFGDDLEVSI
jgi:pyruvate kinase